MSDLALGSYGGGLKLREKITGRYADVLSWLYLATATMHRFESEGRKKEHLPYAEWALQYAFAQVQQAFEGIYDNIEIPLLRPLFRGPIQVWSRLNSFGGMPDDVLGRKVAQGLCVPGQLRDDITWGVYLPESTEEAIGRYEHTLNLVTEANGVYHKIVKAMKAKKLPRGKPDRMAKKLSKPISSPRKITNWYRRLRKPRRCDSSGFFRPERFRNQPSYTAER